MNNSVSEDTENRFLQQQCFVFKYVLVLKDNCARRNVRANKVSGCNHSPCWHEHFAWHNYQSIAWGHGLSIELAEVSVLSWPWHPMPWSWPIISMLAHNTGNAA